jgi:hypothetical protein
MSIKILIAVMYLISNNSDSIKVKDYELKKEKASICLLGTANDDERVSYFNSVFQYLYTSTEIRSSAWAAVQGSLVGNIYEICVP